jgi:hypothetical protein
LFEQEVNAINKSSYVEEDQELLDSTKVAGSTWKDLKMKMMKADEKDLEWYKKQTDKDKKLLDRLKKA